MTRAGPLSAATALLALFAVMTALVVAGSTVAVDHAILASLRLAGKPGVATVPDWAVIVARGVTHGGDFPVRATLVLPSAILLFAKRRARAAAALLLAVGGAALLVELIKALVARARPDAAWGLAIAHGLSFPSGHAEGAMVTYPLLGLLLGTLAGVAWVRPAVATGVGLALVIGCTRVLLGVHWASDVVAGWLLGGAVACLAASAHRSNR